MRLNIVGKEDVPLAPYNYELVCVPVEIVPQVLHALWLKSQKYWYTDVDNWRRGQDLLAQVGSGLLMPCGQEIINSVDRLYVSFEAHVAGIARTATPSVTVLGAFDYAPALEQSANALAAVAPSLRTDVEKGTALLDNLVTGAVNSYATDPDAIKQLIRDLIAAVQAGEDDGVNIEAILNLILLALG